MTLSGPEPNCRDAVGGAMGVLDSVSDDSASMLRGVGCVANA